MLVTRACELTSGESGAFLVLSFITRWLLLSMFSVIVHDLQPGAPEVKHIIVGVASEVKAIDRLLIEMKVVW